MVEVAGCSSVVVPDCSPSGGVCGRVVWGSPAEVSECSSDVVSGAEDVPPACSAESSGVRAEGWGAGVCG